MIHQVGKKMRFGDRSTGRHAILVQPRRRHPRWVRRNQVRVVDRTIMGNTRFPPIPVTDSVSYRGFRFAQELELVETQLKQEPTKYGRCALAKADRRNPARFDDGQVDIQFLPLDCLPKNQCCQPSGSSATDHCDLL